MPRKAEPTFELKKIIWLAAISSGRSNLSAIQKQVDYELQKRHLPDSKDVEVYEDTPDTRTIKRIIDEDINELSPSFVVSELPAHVWELRRDSKNIKQKIKEWNK